MSSSSSSRASQYTTVDKRVAVDGQNNVAVSGDTVTIHHVPDEAFELGELALMEMGNTTDAALMAVQSTAQETTREIGDALFRTLEAEREESARLSEQAIRLGIPVAGLAFAVWAIWGQR
ncbi:hypothetical protein [Yoonia sp.]|uniref:hypothetical protein n=1 Tax=Yoonia sp. TaxID=2212373 RepID=UPI002DFB6295|nr:hypothetical protein [Yoonia sp.]